VALTHAVLLKREQDGVGVGVVVGETTPLVEQRKVRAVESSSSESESEEEC